MSIYLPNTSTLAIIVMTLGLGACEGLIKDWVKGSGDRPPSADTGSTIAPTTLTWDFTDPTKYSYDSNYVEITNGSASIKQVDQLHSTVEFNSETHVGTHVDANGNVSLLDQASLANTHVNAILPTIADDLISYWRLDDDLSDATNNHSDATTGGDGFSFSPISKLGSAAVTFNSTNQHINLPTSAPAVDFTLSQWIKVSVAQVGAVYSSGPTSGCSPSIRQFRINNYIPEFSVGCGGTTQSSTGVKPGEWTHIVWTIDSLKNGQIFINGKKTLSAIDISGGQSFGTDNDRLGISYSANSFNSPYEGSIDEVSLWGRVLTQAQVSALYNGQNLNYTELSASWTPKYDNIVGHWNMDGNWQDSSGGGNHGTAFGIPVFASDSMVGSHSGFFDNVDDYIEISDVDSLDNTSNLSASFWVKALTLDGSSDGLISKRTNYNVASSYSIFLSLNDKIRVYIDSDNDAFSSNTIILTDQWYHVVVVFDGTLPSGIRSNLYINGELDITSAETSTSIPNYSSNLYIGKLDAAFADLFHGYIDDIGIWNQSFSSTDVTEIYNRQKQKYAGHYDSLVMDLGTSGSWENIIPKTTLPFYKEITSPGENSSDYASLIGDLGSGLVGAWHFNENSWGDINEEVVDSSGKGHHGRAKNGADVNLNGFLGNSAIFDGSNDYIVIQDHLDFNPSNITLSLWANIGTFSTRPHLAGKGGAGSGVIYLTVETSGEIRCYYDIGSNWQYIDGNGVTPIFGKWQNYLCSYDGSNVKLYMDGVELNSSNAPGSLRSDNTSDLIFGTTLFGSNPLKGGLDEVGIWNRALTNIEIQQLYRRSANRIKYQVKSCVDAACKCKSLDVAGDINDCDGDGTPNASDTADIHFSQWLGKAGATGESFSELQNCSVIDALTGDCDFAALATVNAGSANFNFGSYPAAARPANNRYFQYRVLMEAEDNLACSNATCVPELTSVEVGPTGRSFGGIYSITTSSPVTFTELTSMSFHEGGSCSLTYQLSPDGSTFYYWNSSTWVPASGFAQSSTATDVTANVTAFTSQIGTGSLYWKAFMNSSAAQSCQIDEVSVNVIQ